MLVLSRRIGESFSIYPNDLSENGYKSSIDAPIQITILGVRGRQIRIGITAPASLNVVRDELIKNELCEST
jgi:sRNA-binding carbon storage regulator CsrA